MATLAVHQIQYLPTLSYFHKIANCDFFVFLDDVQYKKREFQNRNKIRTPHGWEYLTVPVLTKGKFFQKLNDVLINNSYDWRKEHLKSIQQNYHKSKYFKNYEYFFQNIYSKVWERLIDVSFEIIKFLLDVFEIKTPFCFSSELNISTTKTQRIIDICKKLSADTYLSGIGGKDYLDEELFKKENINLIYQDFKYPIYQQLYSGFESYLSSIDLIFNCGPESKNILLK